LCQLADPIGGLVSSGESFPFFFDSGSECSLVKESVAQRLSGPRINNVVALKGIEDSAITSGLQILSNVIINEYSLSRSS